MHRAPRADRLVGALAEAIAVPMAEPLVPEVVAVPSRGIERWISQELSARLGTGNLGSDGVCANVEFPFPGRLIREAVAVGSGINPDRDPWLPERLTWPLLAIVDGDRTAPMLGPLRAHVGGQDDDGTGLARRLSAVRRLADLFDHYGVHRPAMICRWRDGDDVGPDGTPLASRHHWQPQLWRAVRYRLDLPSFAERHAAALAALRDDPSLLDLPPRLAMFGLTALPATFLEVVAALGVHRDLHLLVLHPSRNLWDRIHDLTASDRGSGQILPLRDADATADLPRNPLLRSWGRDVRELQLTSPLPADATVTHHDLTQDDPDAPPGGRGPTLLERLQAAVRDDIHPGAPTGGDKPLLDPQDRSVQLHDCHGRLRQVEVLRDVILHLLDDDDGPELRDVIVMCPDIETFAPLITAVFGADAIVDDRTAPNASPPDAPPSLRVRLADRSLRGTNPVLEVVSQVLELADGRVTASDVLDLLASEPVRRRFGFAEDDLGTLEAWVGDLRIRWGFDAAHRERHGLPALDAHTWRAGVERLLLGAAMADEDLRLVDGVAPYDGLEGQATELAGRFVELLTRLADVLADLADPRPVDGWREAVGTASDRLTATDGDTTWQRLQLHRILDEFVDEASTEGRPNPVALTLPEVRTVLAARLTGRPTTSSHRTGDLTFSTLVPMRSVPHRAVCLLGLDDGAFPRRTVADSDDLLAAAPRVGDHDAHSEDRQLLLDALLAATETLVVTWSGRDVRTNADRSPAVPVDELLDVIDRTVARLDDRRPRHHLVVRHPLAEHDQRNFTPGALLQQAGPWGFDPATLAAAEAARSSPAPPAPFLATPLPPLDIDVIELGDLVAFLEHPAEAFVRQRLEVTLPTGEDATVDQIVASLEGLDEWKVGDSIVQGWRDGDDPERTLAVVRARGLVPPGALADVDIDRIRGHVDRIIALCGRIGVQRGNRDTVDVRVTLPDGRLLVGSVPDVLATGASRMLTAVGYSKVKPKQRLAAWTRWLALSAHDPTAEVGAVTIGRHPWQRNTAQAVLLRRPADDAQDVAAYATTQLRRLVDLYDRGMRSPLPLFCEASAKVADNLHRVQAAEQYVAKVWETDAFAPLAREDLDPYHLLVLGRQMATDDLLAEVCRDAEEESWADDHRRFVAYAWRLWEPVLAAEQRRQQS
ncbi:exodeoxyribonuclease V subunit gamma [Egicoccus sp. AB-alg2]|uniref:exodeoxyribonuclease V subunit gamma n=1 Tax=Egicoccus sp. AB-alg2 TaxID=3242693 RepID=UPI00359D0F53